MIELLRQTHPGAGQEGPVLEQRVAVFPESPGRHNVSPDSSITAIISDNLSHRGNQKIVLRGSDIDKKKGGRRAVNLSNSRSAKVIQGLGHYQRLVVRRIPSNQG